MLVPDAVVPDAVRRAAYRSLASHDADSEVADLVFDSALDRLCEPPGHRQLCFAGASGSIEIEVRSNGTRRSLTVRLSPVRHDTVQVMSSHGHALSSARTNWHGTARIDDVPAGVMSVRTRSPRQETAWVRI
jgi:hypothetical protein